MSAHAHADAAIRPLRRAEYDQLVAAGAFVDERVELLDGRLILVSPQGPVHASVVQVLNDLLVRALGDRAYIRPRLPVAASDVSDLSPISPSCRGSASSQATRPRRSLSSKSSSRRCRSQPRS